MKHQLSKDDLAFKEQVETCCIPVSDFDHKAHLRLAYVYLVANDVNQSVTLMRETLIRLLRHVGIDPAKKFHETMTEAWILAVHHFMKKTDIADSANAFIAQNPSMLDSNIMLTHYSADVLFSETARQRFVEPDLDPIQR